MMKNKVFERLFQAGAGFLALAAAYYYWQGDFDRVFVSAALGSLSFFIAIRFQVKQRLIERAAEKEIEESLAGVRPIQQGTPSEIYNESVKTEQPE